jgi:hypothetical protein
MFTLSAECDMSLIRHNLWLNVQYVAGFGKGGTSLAFWENVYGFNMRCVGEEVVHDATQSPIIDIVDSKEVITTTSLLQVNFCTKTVQRGGFRSYDSKIVLVLWV